MKGLFVSLIASAISLWACGSMEGASIFVPASADIYAAGGNRTTTGLPAWEIAIADGHHSESRALTFSFTSGDVAWKGASYLHISSNPDGRPTSDAVVENAINRLSGVAGSDFDFPLYGVFLGGALPEAAPASLDFSENGLGHDFLFLAPQLGQVFFVGDGFTSTGFQQQFIIPQGATRFFLGFSDDDWSDNSGGYFINYELSTYAIPEPSTVAILAVLGFGGLVLKRRR